MNMYGRSANAYSVHCVVDRKTHEQTSNNYLTTIIHTIVNG